MMMVIKVFSSQLALPILSSVPQLTHLHHRVTETEENTAELERVKLDLTVLAAELERIELKEETSVDKLKKLAEKVNSLKKRIEANGVTSGSLQLQSGVVGTFLVVHLLCFLSILVTVTKEPILWFSKLVLGCFAVNRKTKFPLEFSQNKKK